MSQIKRWGWTLLMLVLLPLAAADAQAQLKIGFANPDALVGSMSEYETAMQTLQREVQTSQQALQAMQDEFQEKAARFEQQRPLLTSEESINRRQQELAVLYQEIQTAAATEDNKLANRQTELIQPQVAARAAEFGGDRDAGIADLLAEKQPTRRTSDPAEIGALALWLCAREAHNVTGAAIPVDGGWTAQ